MTAFSVTSAFALTGALSLWRPRWRGPVVVGHLRFFEWALDTVSRTRHLALSFPRLASASLDDRVRRSLRDLWKAVAVAAAATIAG